MAGFARHALGEGRRWPPRWACTTRRRFRRCRRYRRRGADAPRRTERAGLKGQTFHGHREQSAPVGRRTRCCAKRRQPQGQAPKPLNFKASTKLLRRFSRNEEAQGMGTIERPVGPNGEVPRPLRSFCVFVEKKPAKLSWRRLRFIPRIDFSCSLLAPLLKYPRIRTCVGDASCTPNMPRRRATKEFFPFAPVFYIPNVEF